MVAAQNHLRLNAGIHDFETKKFPESLNLGT